MADNFGFKSKKQQAKEAFGFKSKVFEQQQKKQEIQQSQSIYEQAKERLLAATTSMLGVIPFSDQILAMSTTARQFASGEIGMDDIVDQVQKNAQANYQQRKELQAKYPLEAGTGIGFGAVGTAIATGGLSAAAQAGIGLTQAAGIGTGERVAAGKDWDEAIKGGVEDAALAMGMMTAPSLVKVAGKTVKNTLEPVKGAIDGAMEKFTGLTKNERLGDKLLKFFGASPTQSRKIYKEAPDLAKSLIEEGLIESRFTPMSKVHKNANKKFAEVGKELEEIYKESNSQINTSEIADLLEQRASVMEYMSVTPSEKQLVEKLNKIAKDTAERNNTLSSYQAWRERVAWDKEAFQTNKAFTKTGELASKADSDAAKEVREVYKFLLNKKIKSEMGTVAAETLEEGNKRYSNLTKLKLMAESARFKSSPNVLDRMTIGSAVAATRNPIVGLGLFGGREILQYTSPRGKFLAPRQPEQVGPLRSLVPRTFAKPSVAGPTAPAIREEE